MSKSFILLWMIFFHIVDDYYLQGWLASAKQRSWWVKNEPRKLYRRDYLWALFMHSFSWAFMVMLPIAYFSQFDINRAFVVMFWVNVVAHAFVDNAKANWRLINLWQDQTIHMVQILATFVTLIIYA